MQRSASINVPKKYLKDCCTNGINREPFDDSPSHVNEINRDLFIQILYYHTRLAPEVELIEMQNVLAISGSPESILFTSAQPMLDQIISAVQQEVKTLEKKELNPEENRKQIKIRLKTEIENYATQLTEALTPQVKEEVAKISHNRRQDKIISNDIGPKISAVDKASPGSGFVLMDLKRQEDPLYSPDMIQHLIRLRLNDPNPLKYSYAQTERQSFIPKGNRIWLGLYELCDLKVEDMQAKRHQCRTILGNELSFIPLQDRKKEICISVRAFSRNNSGHYLLLSLLPDSNNKGKYIMRCLNSNRTNPDITAGIPGELLAIATQCGYEVSFFEAIVLISQPTNHGCGPTHVEIVSAVMTQKSIYGAVPLDYTQQPTIEDKMLAEEVLVSHTFDLISHDLTREALILRGGEESIFKMVETGKKENDFGFIPPMVEHLEGLGIAPKKIQAPIKLSPPARKTSLIPFSPIATSEITNLPPEFSTVLEKINILKAYGIKLQAQHPLPQKGWRKGQEVIDLADSILNEVRHNNKKSAGKNLSQIIVTGKKSMGKDRKIIDIIAHIVLALTGIGFAIILGKKWITGSFFLNSTHRQKLLRNIHREVNVKGKIKPR